MQTTYKNCQSCSMPLKRDENGGGTNADGTKSAMYCSKCYQNGQFTQPNMTAPEMQAFVKDIMKKHGLPGFIAGWFTKGIPNLERWKGKS